jgi:L-2-hydroxyglutarate oxidase
MSTGHLFDVCIVGTGLVGLAVGRALSESHQGIKILLIEKENDIAAHQSSHNSGVIHSGLYYRPGSLKAKLTVEGREAIYRMCEAAGISHRRSGKLVIATAASQVVALDELERRGRANGLHGIRRLGPAGIREFEPNAVGLDALLVPEAGVVDFPGIARHLADELRRSGAAIATGSPVVGIEREAVGLRVSTGEEGYRARVLVNCAGLYSDKVAEIAGIRPQVRIVPFRGEYYRLDDPAARLVNGLIYPVPDPRFPFLGVHFTRRFDETVEVGPNAVLALGREHYRHARANWSELAETLRHPGFRRLARRNLWSGSREMMSSKSTRLYARSARKLVPAIESRNLLAGGAGVRAQAVAIDGSLVDDFVIEQTDSMVHVLNAPSPGATASLAIGRYIADQTHPLLTRAT